MGLISKDEFNTLKTRLIAEHTRRSTAYTVTAPTLVTGDKITAAYHDALRTDVQNKFVATITDENPGDYIDQTSFDSIKNKVDVLRNDDITKFALAIETSNCGTGCAGGCVNTCSVSCSTGCTGGCGGCGGCGGSCSGACTSCSGGC